MTRGIELAIPFALRRGHVMVFVPSIVNLGELIITGNGWFVLVGVRFAQKFSVGITEIESGYAETITRLRLVPRGGPVTSELWLYSRYGTMRHFRVGDTGIEEIDCYGTPAGQVRPIATGSPARGSEVLVLPGPVAPGLPASGAAHPRDPYIRWLSKRNAAKKGGEGADIAGIRDLKKILDAGGPGTKREQTPGKKPEPVTTIPQEKPASPPATIPVSEESLPDNTPGSPERSRGVEMT